MVPIAQFKRPFLRLPVYSLVVPTLTQESIECSERKYLEPLNVCFDPRGVEFALACLDLWFSKWGCVSHSVPIWDTAPGHPWCDLCSEKDKVYDTHMPLVLEYVRREAAGDPNLSVKFMVFPKVEPVELRKKEKPRTCANAPLHHYLFGAMLMGWIAKLFDWTNSPLMFGFGKNDGRVNRLARILGDECFPGDFSGWDRSVSDVVRQHIVDWKVRKFHLPPQLVKNFYKHEFQCWCLYPWGELVRHLHGVASGSPMTSQDNSFMNLFYQAYVGWSSGMFKSPLQFVEALIFRVLGDDFIIGYVTELGREYLLRLCPEMYAKVGLELKPTKLLPLTECEFLGFSFRLLKCGYYVPSVHFEHMWDRFALLNQKDTLLESFDGLMKEVCFTKMTDDQIDRLRQIADLLKVPFDLALVQRKSF